MISKLLLQHIMVVSDTDIYPELFEYISNNHLHSITLPMPLSLDVCQDFVLFFKELEDRQLYEQYLNLIKSKESNNFHVLEMKRIIKHILKLQDMLTQIKDICTILSCDDMIDNKIRNSLYECSEFINLYMYELSYSVSRDHMDFLNHEEDTMFFLEILSNCFLDIYALEYIVHQTKFYCFRNYLEILYENQLESIKDDENWEVMMICDDKPSLLSHIYLPHPDDFKYITISC